MVYTTHYKCIKKTITSIHFMCDSYQILVYLIQVLFSMGIGAIFMYLID